ncbi:MAG TPA: prolipoprotein diacylglyceryl transferase [Candidatus Coatesbacteria bacterium]|nr:prolipoprotein diacylglyceryl transferase [Candidatus Coatesbacteria bacterium]
MHPILFTIGPLTLRVYGLMLALSFFGGMLLAAWRARNRGIDQRHIYDLSLVILICAVVGARLFHFIFHFDQYAYHGDPWVQLLRIWDGGLMLFGGFIFALAGSVVYLWRKRLPVWKITDIVAPSVALGLGITRIGCFFNGCCYGRATDSWLGMVFPHNAAVYYELRTGIPPGTPVLPTQLFESAAGFFLFGLLLFVERKWKRFHGLLFGILIAFFGAWRLFIEEFRFREDDMWALGGFLSKNQVISIVILLVGVGVALWRWLADKKAGRLLEPAVESAAVREAVGRRRAEREKRARRRRK